MPALEQEHDESVSGSESTVAPEYKTQCFEDGVDEDDSEGHGGVC